MRLPLTGLSESPLGVGVFWATGRDVTQHGDEFGPAGDAELAVGPGEVGLHCPQRHEEALGDLLVAVSLGGQSGDAFFMRPSGSSRTPPAADSAACVVQPLLQAPRERGSSAPDRDVQPAPQGCTGTVLVVAPEQRGTVLMQSAGEFEVKPACAPAGSLPQPGVPALALLGPYFRRRGAPLREPAGSGSAARDRAPA